MAACRADEHVAAGSHAPCVLRCRLALGRAGRPTAWRAGGCRCRRHDRRRPLRRPRPKLGGGEYVVDDEQPRLLAARATHPEGAAAAAEIVIPKPDEDTENVAADEEINKDSPLESDKSDVIPVANGVPDASTSTTAIVPTEADLEELENLFLELY